MELIQLKEVTKDFGRQRVLKNVNITIEEGDIFGIIGPSGSGKSTLLNLMTGFIEPTEGNIFYMMGKVRGPKELGKYMKYIKREIGFAPQNFSFYPELTVKENLLYFGKLHDIKPKTLINNIKSLLMQTKLWDQRNKIAVHLSGGMKKRLDIACSILHKPKVLVLDEPVSDLDPILQKDILTFLRQINQQGITIVVASHHLSSIERICNKIAFIKGGIVTNQGFIEDFRKGIEKDHFIVNLKTGQKKEHLIELLRRLPIKKIIEKENSLTVYSDNINLVMHHLLNIIESEDLHLYEIDLGKFTLSEIFEKINFQQNQTDYVNQNQQ